MNEKVIINSKEQTLKSNNKRLKSLIEKTEFEEGKVLNLDLYNQTTNENVSQCLSLPNHNTQRLYDGLRIRKLTPKECWRLMGFDDEDFEKAEKVNSNTQLYKQAGNSIVVDVLESIFKNLLDKDEHIKLLELFGGIGACTKALKRLGINVEIVDYVEIDKYAVKSYNAINDTNFEAQDITKWDKDVNVDLLVGGFPCQDISLAGKQNGIIKGKTRSGLMYEMMRIIEKTKPKYVIAENVKNLLAERFRPQLEEYLCFLNDNGYSVTMDVLNAKDYGIPQNRERVFIVGVRDEENNI